MKIDKVTLNVEQIKKEVPDSSVYYFDQIDSTNSWLLDHGVCGDICLSEMQNKGRGRRGNTWVSPNTGNIYLSLCWCFDEIPKHLTLLGLVVGIAIAEVLEDIGLENHGIKWPNDIFWDQKKLGGILIETKSQTGKVIIGIGLNKKMPSVYAKGIEQAITNIDEALPNITSREEIITKLILNLGQHLRGFIGLNLNQFLSSWKKWDILFDEVISFEFQGDKVLGKVVGIDQYGRLGVLENNGNMGYFSSLEIKVRRHEFANTVS